MIGRPVINIDILRSLIETICKEFKEHSYSSANNRLNQMCQGKMCAKMS